MSLLYGNICIIFLLFKYCLLRFRWLRSIRVISCCRYAPMRLHGHSSLTTTDAYSPSSAYAGAAVEHDWPVTSSLSRMSTPGEIPVISSHRAAVFTNNHQLISCTHGNRCPSESAVCRCRSTVTSHQRRRRTSTGRLTLRVMPLWPAVTLINLLCLKLANSRQILSREDNHRFLSRSGLDDRRFESEITPEKQIDA